MKLFTLSIFLLIGSLSIVYAQEPLVRNYATQKVNKRLGIENPAIAQNQRAARDLISEKSKKLKFKKVTLPLVFHIVYAPGQEYPSEEQIYPQIDALNRDFSKKAYRVKHPADTLANFSKRVADTQIEFCLAKEGPDGSKESAIRFIEIEKIKWSSDDAIKSSETGVPPWDTEKYLNIWVAHMEDEASGYAQFPGGPSQTDGIVIDRRFFGESGTAAAPYNEGKTLTHLIGNYLGLNDLWDEENECGDDFIDDTPNHNAPNFGCPRYKHVSMCDGYPVEMIMNFMDNTDDACSYMFTKGQKLRMQASLSEGGPRYSLVETKTKCTNKSQAENLDPQAGEIYLHPLEVNIFPNPASQEIHLTINSQSNSPLDLKVINASGAVILIQEHQVIKGTQELNIDCNSWANGIYTLQLTTGIGSINHRIVISGNQ